MIIVLPSTLIGGALIAIGARHIRGDMSMVVEELREEQAELSRIAARRARRSPRSRSATSTSRTARCRCCSTSASTSTKGETLALLGTNGAGKSTLLRVVSGLGVASRGVVRFNGRTVTYADPELRVQIGIVQLIGGGATFPPLSVDENLRMAGFQYSRSEQAPAHRPGARDLPDARRAAGQACAGPVGRPAADARAGDDTRSTNPRC